MAQYGRTAYWDERYTKDSEPFDWYQRYDIHPEFAALIQKYIKKEDGILMAGCGVSRLSEEMWKDGYQSIVNIDISRVAIDHMESKYKENKALTFQQMNVCSLEFPNETFEAVIAKGLMDAILCGEGSIANADKMMSEISRVLKPNGVFLVITPGDLDQRLKYLDPDNDGGHRYEWTIQKDTMPKPRVAGAVADAGGLHYCYTCQKGKLDGEEGEEGAEGAAAAEGGAAADPAAEAPAEAS